MAIDQQLYAIKDNSIWQSKTHEQYADQSDWTNYHVREDETGSQRLIGIARGGDDVAETTTTELYVYPNTDKEARFGTDKWIYITSSEFPKGKRITLGARELVSDVRFRHIQSNPNQNFIEGHSLHKETNIPISRYDSVVYKKRSYTYFYNAEVTDDDGNIVDTVKTEFVQDSPFPGDDTGKCVVVNKEMPKTWNFVDKPNRSTMGAATLYWYNDDVNNMSLFADKNRYYSFFFKIPEDFEWPTDDDGNPLKITLAMIPLYRNLKYNDRDYDRNHLLIQAREDGHIEYQIIYAGNPPNIFPDKTDTSVYHSTSEISNQNPNINDGNWHNIVVSLQDDKSIIVFVDNYEYIREKVLDFTGPTINGMWSNLITLAPAYSYLSRLNSAQAVGVRFAQVEIYNDTYNPDKDDYNWLTKPSQEYYNYYVKYDISGNNLQAVPENIYRQTDITLWCSMAPDAASIEDHWEIPTEEGFYISVSDADPENLEDVQPIDTVTRQYTPMYRRGRAFAIKYTCNLGDIIKPYTLIQLNT